MRNTSLNEPGTGRIIGCWVDGVIARQVDEDAKRLDLSRSTVARYILEDFYNRRNSKTPAA